MRKVLCIIFLFSSVCLTASQSVEELLYALEIVDYWDQKLCQRFPLTYNHILATGYFTTHSARMAEEGAIGIGGAHTPPYFNWNMRIQPFCFLDFSVNYRIFRGCEDVHLSPYGFGDYADRGANVKVAIVNPEQSFYHLPGFAFGIDDFMGSKKFTTYFLVATQVWPEYGLEVSAGWGAGQYTKGPSRGFFGGFNWFPLYCSSSKWVKGLCLTAEYDPTNYRLDPHPDGRVTHTPLNVGAKYNLCDLVELSASYIRGCAFAASGSLHYNWGKTEGFLPKIHDPNPYTSPIDRQPLGCYRPAEVMIQSISYSLEDQGFKLIKAWLDGETLWVRLMNGCYRQEQVVRERLQKLFAALTPSNIETVVVELESYGFVCQQYVYSRALLMHYAHHCMSPFEMDVVSPREEACISPPGELIFHRRYDLWKGRIGPRIENFFGSASGKYKYDVGVKLDLEGFLPHGWFYEVQLSTTLFSDLTQMSDFDLFHPSQIPNVATDYVRYRQSHALSWDRLYLQKSWNLGHGFFGRLAGGYFQVNYGGVAAEVLWYRASSLFAIGIEGASVKKRNYTGLGFQSTIRHFKGDQPVFNSYTTLEQYFLNVYFDISDLKVFTKFSIGQFLARDKGVRLELTKYFDNGIRFTGWMTFTDANDNIHERNYYDRGVCLEIPFDFFYRCSSRRIWNYAMAAWLRDAGYATWTGQPLFDTINRERR